MSCSHRISTHSSRGRFFGRAFAVAMLVVSGVALVNAAPASAVLSPQRIDLKVLLLDDDSPWVDAIQSQLQVEGVPYTAVPLSSSSRPVIGDSFLSAGDEAFYQAVVAPDNEIAALTVGERASLRAFEAKFGVREVDAYQWANPTVGLNYSDYIGDLDGTTATVTDAAKAAGFGYLNGPVPYSAGSYSYVARPLDAASMPAGASYTTLLSVTAPNGATGSVMGVYSSGGVEELVIGSAFSFSLPQFKYVSHGIISWMTRGVHFGYNRNNFSFQADDAFSSDSIWDSTRNCTPGEDCSGTETSMRMTADDVAYAVDWMAANDYQLTLPFNGHYADLANDPLTQAFVANESAFRWLNHGSEHIFQGCVQDFTVTPWRCQTDAQGHIVWVSQQAIYNEIADNIALGQSIGLTFDSTEYLSGEHSGLFLLPQQQTDNPNFAAALTQLAIKFIASDASRDNTARQVGSATTIPRHPTVLYYNTSTQAEAVDEYNWLYNTRANGGSGYCQDNPTVATCLPAPLDPATGFTSYIVPTDANFDLSFILSNDPRPFYAHVTNLTGDRLAYELLDAILGSYRSAFTDETPLLNLTLTQASTQLARQTRWAATTNVTGFVQNGQITISNPSGVAVPFTAPTGTALNGTTLESYGGESSAWLNAGSTSGSLPGALQMTVTGSPSFVVGTNSTITVAATGDPIPTVSITGALPAGVTFTASAAGATISGAPAAGTGGSYPITLTATSGTATKSQQLAITVVQPPQFTSVATATVVTGAAFTFDVATTGYPTATITRSGTLPTGVTFTAGANGTARLSGTPSTLMAGRTFPIVLTAKSSSGVATQAFVLNVVSPSSVTLTVSGSTAFKVGTSSTINITSTGVPTPTVSLTGALPKGVTFSTTAGRGVISGAPAAGAGGSYPITVKATNGPVSRTQNLTITVSQVPAFTSAASATAATGTAFSFTVTSTGYPSATISRSGTLPSGVSFVAGANGTARLSGTPSPSTAGRTYTLTFTARNSAGTTTQAFTLTVGGKPTFASLPFGLALSGRAYTTTIQTTGSPTPSIALSGRLPTGLTFVDNRNGTARISGTPARSSSGVYTLTITASNTYGGTTTTFTLIVL